MQLFAETMHPQNMEFRDYIEALEEERKKIQVFNKELPLSLELVTRAIEACKQQLSGTTTEYNLNGLSECSEQTSTEEGPVFEEFIPIKRRASSPDYDDDDEEQQHSHKQKIPKDSTNSDWLRSVQLWNPDPPSTKEDVPRKASVVEVKRNGGGAFQPFHREESTNGKANDASNDKAPSSPQVPATSSTGPVTKDHVDGSSNKEEKGLRKQRRSWSQELHKRFLHALHQLGGADSATPKQIRELMKVDGLTNDEVKSHLQKFRLHNRRPNLMIHKNNTNSQAAPLFLVGNIFVQPQEYATAIATSSGELTTVTAPTGIYAPVASHPPIVTHKPEASIQKLQFKQLELSEHSNSEERANHSEGAGNSNSPTSSSSTHITTTSPAC
ncbi:PREDICTED: myb family transcription factor EFM-like [Lupinus angustifolius]|uniref:myb family transcription factor EFM-like n=1 Tax=Lupinus angustifolius TaxID=3871 RepID=UPI00092EAE55|nr:PREDICTED: myb family transcription factor EFM-like [Lupinus angustifolius]